MITIIMGGQFGSEGKGAFTHWWARTRRPAAVVRTGGPNAGHSILVGTPPAVFKLRHLPAAADVPGVDLLIARGAVVNRAVLESEIARAGGAFGLDLSGRFFLDTNATMLEEEHAGAEADLVRDIASTGEGVGAARAARVMRRARTAGDACAGLFPLADTAVRLLRLLEVGHEVVIETPQGAGLSLHGPFYPFCTSADISPAQALADCGLAPTFPVRTLLVVRSFPIRVGGRSGPLRNEIAWDDLRRETRGYVDVPERTTVTNRERRIGRWDGGQVRNVCEEVRPDAIALTFLDYVDPDTRFATDAGALSQTARDFVARVEDDCGRPVRYVSVGFERVLYRPE